MNVSELMRSSIPTVTLHTTVGQVASLLIDSGLPAIPVLDDGGTLAGVVTLSDLIVKHANVHGPTFLGILGGIIPFETRRQDEEIRRALGTTAADVMSTKFSTVDVDDDIDEAATIMVEHDQPAVVVLSDSQVVGLVGELDIVRLLVAEEGDGDGSSRR
jgi:CBS domain-containing protein